MSRRFAAGLVGALLATLAACGVVPVDLPKAVAPPASAATERVSGVVDGDTLKLTNASGAQRTVRVLGIDTPETKDPRKPVMCGGAEATTFAKSLMLGEQVTVIPDTTQDQLDKYNRGLGYIKLKDGSDYGQRALEGGWAAEYTYRVPYERQAEYRAAQAQAKQAKVGVWGKCNGITTPVDPGTTTGYTSCAAVRQAGKAPIHEGDPGWNPRLDANGDGVACG